MTPVNATSQLTQKY